MHMYMHDVLCMCIMHHVGVHTLMHVCGLACGLIKSEGDVQLR